MKHTLDIENWDRKEHFNFFRQFDEPFFGVTVTINCTRAYRKAKAEGMSFFLLYLHKALAAANAVENFRYRISGNQVTAYDRVDAGPTIMRPNNTFGFGYIYFNEDFSTFTQAAREEIRRVKESTSLMPLVSGENIIHFSTVQ